MVDNIKMSCDASNNQGDKPPKCPSDQQELSLPLDKYHECCEQQNQKCERACPTILYQGQELKYVLSSSTKLTGADLFGAFKADEYNCACKEPDSLKTLKKNHTRWPQSIASASTKLQKIKGFSLEFFEQAATASGFFPAQGLVVLDKEKWTTILYAYNRVAVTALDIEKAIGLLDGEESPLDMKMIAIVGGVIFVLFLILIFMMKRSSSSRNSNPRWKQKADREVEMLKRDPDKARQYVND